MLCQCIQSTSPHPSTWLINRTFATQIRWTAYVASNKFEKGRASEHAGYQCTTHSPAWRPNITMKKIAVRPKYKSCICRTRCANHPTDLRWPRKTRSIDLARPSPFPYPPHLASRLKKELTYTSTPPPRAFMADCRKNFTCISLPAFGTIYAIQTSQLTVSIASSHQHIKEVKVKLPRYRPRQALGVPGD